MLIKIDVCKDSSIAVHHDEIASVACDRVCEFANDWVVKIIMNDGRRFKFTVYGREFAYSAMRSILKMCNAVTYAESIKNPKKRKRELEKLNAYVFSVGALGESSVFSGMF